MQDNTAPTQAQKLDPQQTGPSPVPTANNLPGNNLTDLLQNQPMASVNPIPVVEPASAELPSVEPVKPIEQVAQMPTEHLDIDSASKPITPPSAPVMPNTKPADLPVETPSVDAAVTPEINPVEPEMPKVEEVNTVAEIQTVTAPADMAPTSPAPSIPSDVDPGMLNVTDMMSTKPVEEPVEQPEEQPTKAEESEPQETLPSNQMSPTAKAESLDVLNDIIPTPVVEQPVAAATNAETELPTAPAGPVSIAPEGQLSQVFELTPSDVAIPSNETSTVVQTEPAMVPISSVNSTNPVPEMVSVGLNQNTAVNYQKTNQKNGRSGGVLRYILWMFILILGVVAVILGAYLANLIQIPFLNSIFGR